MSRKGKKIISITDNVEISQENEEVFVKGPKGSLSLKVKKGIKIKRVGNDLKVINEINEKNSNCYHGLYQSLIYNMVNGVTNGYNIKLELNGVGYRVQKKGEGLNLLLGY
jgi:large subunit ribosomal protein L6